MNSGYSENNFALVFQRDFESLFVDGAQTDVDGAQTYVDGAQTDVDGTQTDVDGAQTDVDSAQTDVDGAQTDIDGAQTDVDGAQTDVDDAQTDIDVAVATGTAGTMLAVETAAMRRSTALTISVRSTVASRCMQTLALRTSISS